ncbi:hypothetical protein GCM10010199_07260 [Dactylosporangium roseum]
MAPARCPADAAHEILDRPLSGHGVVFSFTVTHQPMRASAGDRVPYATVLVELDEGPRVLAHVDASLPRPAIGQPVLIRAQDDADDPHIPPGAYIATARPRTPEGTP